MGNLPKIAYFPECFLVGNMDNSGRPIPIQFNHAESFPTQWETAFAATGPTEREWKTEKFIVVLPAFNYVAALASSELLGRMGYFPSIVRMKPVEGAMPPRFEVAEIINLQATYETARKGG